MSDEKRKIEISNQHVAKKQIQFSSLMQVKGIFN